jgi:hypothetical protein
MVPVTTKQSSQRAAPESLPQGPTRAPTRQTHRARWPIRDGRHRARPSRPGSGDGTLGDTTGILGLLVLNGLQ